MIFAATMHLIHLLNVSFFILIKSHKGVKFQEKTTIEQLSFQSAAANKSSQRSHHHSVLTADMCLIFSVTLFTPLSHGDHLISNVIKNKIRL